MKHRSAPSTLRTLTALATIASLVLCAFGSLAALAEQKPDLGPDGLPRVQMGAIYAEPPSRTSMIDLGKITGDTGEVELVNLDHPWKEPFKLSVFGSQARPDRPLRFNLTPGRYELKLPEGTKIIEVGRAPPLPILPRDGAKLSLFGVTEGVIPFEWEDDLRAREYFFEILDSKGHLTKRIRTQNTWVFVVLDQEGAFSWRVTSIVDPKRKGEDAPRVLKGSFTVVTREGESKRTVRLAIERVPRAVMYQVELNGLDEVPDADNRSVIMNSWRPQFEFKVYPGNYTLRSRAYFIDKGYTEWSRPEFFSVPLGYVPALAPALKEKIKPQSVEGNSVTLMWKRDPLASEYWLEVFVKGEEEPFFAGAVAGTSKSLELEHDKTYRWTVRALLPLSTPGRKPASAKSAPPPSSEFRIVGYPGNNFATAEEPSFLYGWLKGSYATLGYEGLDYDTNARITQNQVTTRAEAAIGYWKPGDTWGLLGYAGQTMLNTLQSTTKYYNFGLLFGRRYVLEGGHRFRIWGGIGHRELPVFRGNPFTGRTRLEESSTLGPDLRAFYLGAFNDIWGYQASASVYYELIGLVTPNGQPLAPSMHLELSLGASYRLSRQFKLYGGYLFQRVGTKYGSTREGQTNSTTATGHSFILTVEFGLRASEPLYLKPTEDSFDPPASVQVPAPVPEAAPVSAPAPLPAPEPVPPPAPPGERAPAETKPPEPQPAILKPLEMSSGAEPVIEREPAGIDALPKDNLVEPPPPIAKPQALSSGAEPQIDREPAAEEMPMAPEKELQPEKKP